MPRIAIVDYEIGNLRSAEKALLHVGADAHLTADVDEIASADGVVVPGVGNFGACMRALRTAGLEPVVLDAARSGRPWLGICVGMQMAFEGSDESPDVAGLGLVAGRVVRLPDSERLPQIGWNTVTATEGSRLFAGLAADPWLYFVHSYAAVPADAAVVSGWCDYGTRFACAIEHDNIWATQFHPEKSGTTGLHVLANFARWVAEAGA